MNEILVEAESVSKRFCKELGNSLRYGVQDIASELSLRRRDGRRKLRPGEFWALKDVSFELRRGEALGIIGPNGAGKSTLFKLISGLMKPDGGRITVRGRVGALIELGTGFSPILTGRENIYVNAAMLGLSKRQTDRIVDEIIGFAGLEEFIDTPVQNYSSGMWVRLGYAVATHLEPDVLLVDEVLAVGDLAFQRKCIRHMHKYLDSGGALVLVSHHLYTLQSICHRCLLLDRGEATFLGTALEAVGHYFETTHDAEPETVQHVPRVRPSTDNPVVIEDIAIRPLAGDEIRTDEAAEVLVRYRSIKAIDRVFWAFGIWSGDLSMCLTGNVAGLEGDGYYINKGYGELRCRVARLPLLSGGYALRAMIGDLETRAPMARFGWESHPVFFSVEGEPTETALIHLISGAVFSMDIDDGALPKEEERGRA